MKQMMNWESEGLAALLAEFEDWSLCNYAAEQSVYQLLTNQRNGNKHMSMLIIV